MMKNVLFLASKLCIDGNFSLDFLLQIRLFFHTFILPLDFWLAVLDFLLFWYGNVYSIALKLWQPVLKRAAY